jgi:hypothetical protein
VPRPADLCADRIELPAEVSDGPALLLVHEEDPAMRSLRQLGVRGIVRDGVLEVTSRRGSLVPRPPRAWGEVQSLRSLARAAKRNRARLATWPTYEHTVSG